VKEMSTTVRICATIPHAEGLARWGRAHEEMIAEIAHENLEVVMVDLPNVPVTAVETRHDADIVSAAHTQAALRAEAEGFDAVAMGCLGEPGVAAAKAMLRIPVIGEAQAAMHMAALVARRFSFVGPGGRDYGADFDHAHRYGFSQHLVSVKGVGSTSASFAFEEEGLAELMIRGSRQAIEADGAQAIIGYGSLGVLRAMRKALPVPVINPVTSGILLAEAAARARAS
jgi:allantoin racemase